ncbi:hypothetical protein B6U64_08670, partial [Ligilactobacillus salivarius]
VPFRFHKVLFRIYTNYTDITDNYTEQDVEHCQQQLNQRPRKVLHYETPYEVFFDKPLHLV